MKIEIAKSAGFCPGVRRASRAVEERIEKAKAMGERVRTLGALIHNPYYTDSLEEKGCRITDIDGIEKELLLDAKTPLCAVIRTHGVTKEDRARLRSLEERFSALTVLDMTCPSVARIHKIAEEETGDGTVFLLFCDEGHPEAVATMSYAKGEKYAFSDANFVEKLNPVGKIPILCAQTTANLVEFEKIEKICKKLYTNAKIFGTICSVTETRQKQAAELAAKCNRMIVIGSKSSANTLKLYEISKKVCEDSHLIESPDEVRDRFPDEVKLTGVTAGASTPDRLLLEVLKTMENFEAMLEESLATIHTGETVTGIVYAVDTTAIYLDLGTKFTGVVKKDQITDDPGAKLSEMYKVGDEVKAFVIQVKDGEGTAFLSVKRVKADARVLTLQAAFENKEVLEGKVTATNKGGVEVTVDGLRIFVPASQTGIARGGDLAVLVGETVKLRLIECDMDKKKFLGSIKSVAAEEKKAAEDAILATLEVGKHYMGTVKNLTQYGAFVDIGGIDGMVHNSELSWKRIKHPSQIVSVGQQIDVFIKEIDAERRRISLGYKTQENDTWFQFTQKFNVGDVVDAKIVSVTAFGAFAEVYEDVDGLIHISRLSTKHVDNPAEIVKVGDVVKVKITEIDDENRKLALSMRALEEEAERAAAAEAKAAADAARAEAKATADAERKAEEERIAAERADMAPYIVGSID